MKNKIFIINGKEKEAVWVEKQGGWDAHWEVDGVQFDGHWNLWSFSYEPKTYKKESHLSGDEWRRGGAMKIFRDGVCVYNEFCRTPERAFKILPYMLEKLQGIQFDYLEVGRKIYHAGVESIIDCVDADGEITVRTESGKDYEIYGFKKEEKKEDPENFEDEWKDKDRIHITDTRISWFRK